MQGQRPFRAEASQAGPTEEKREREVDPAAFDRRVRLERVVQERLGARSAGAAARGQSRRTGAAAASSEDAARRPCRAARRARRNYRARGCVSQACSHIRGAQLQGPLQPRWRPSVASARCAQAHLRATLLGALVLGLCAAPANAGQALVARAPITRGPSVPAALAGLERSGAITQTAYQQDYAAYLAAKRSLGRLSGTRRDRARSGARERAGDRRRRRARPRRASRRCCSDARTQPAVVDERTAALERRARELSGQQARVGVLPRAGPRDPMARHVRRGQRLLPLRTRKRQPAPAPERSDPARDQARRRHRLGVHVPLRRGRSPVDQRPVPGHGAAGARARVVALQRTGRSDRGPAGARHLRDAHLRWACASRRGAGALYAEYTYAPSDRILNGFIQALVGLYDYTSITKDPLGLALFEAGDAEARAEVPRYDTGAWSLYDQFGESNLNYHELLTEFLQHLCERTRKGAAARARERSRRPPPTTTPPAPATPGGASATGGASRGARARPRRAPATADRRRPDLLHDGRTLHHRPSHPAASIALLTSTLPGGTRAGVQISLSKISTRRASRSARAGSVVWTQQRHRRTRQAAGCCGSTPANGGTFSVTLTATDLAGNFATDERHDRREASLAPRPAPRLSAGDGHRDDPPQGRARMTRLAAAWRAMEPEQRLAAIAALGLFVSMFLPWYGQTDTVVGRNDGEGHADEPERLRNVLVRRGRGAARQRGGARMLFARVEGPNSSSRAATARS